MTKSFLIPALALLASFGTNAFAINNDDIIKLTKAGLEDKTIILTIQRSDKLEFDTSTDAIIKLADKGVSSTVINAILELNRNGNVSVAASVNASEAKNDEPAPGKSAVIDKLDPSEILIIADDKQMELLYTSAQVRTAARALGFGGVASYAVLRGSHAQCRINDTTPEFIVSIPERAQVDAFMQLASFAVRKNNSREVLIGGGYMSYSTGIHPDRVMPIHTEKLEDQSQATEGFTLFKVSVERNLAKGEYAVVFYSGEMRTPSATTLGLFGGGNAYFDFGID